MYYKFRTEWDVNSKFDSFWIEYLNGHENLLHVIEIVCGMLQTKAK